jgi:hypothetical protein
MQDGDEERLGDMRKAYKILMEYRKGRSAEISRRR